MISMIVALAENRAIGNKNAIPWHLPADFKYFKEATLGKSIVMGLNTFNSIGGKPLSDRKNIILNNDPNYVPPETCFVAHSIEELLEMIHPVRNAEQSELYKEIVKKLKEGNLDKLSAEIFRKKLSVDGISNGAGDDEELMVCGGASVYKQFLPLSQKLYITEVHASPEGDTYFPEVDINEWNEVKRIDNKADDKNIYDYSFVVLERK
ncbi:MAG: dihydrofolate reductase [Candidatus Staskawiczbacteria bacterium]|nr:dihydrofolate reductase [Candidatus Staskawiczbacteria bacterium]